MDDNEKDKRNIRKGISSRDRKAAYFLTDHTPPNKTQLVYGKAK